MWLAVGISIGLVISLLDYFSKYWYVTRCRCDRPLPWYVGDPHMCHSGLIVRAVVYTSVTVLAVLSGDHIPGIVLATFSAWCWWIVKVHGSGRRKWLKKMIGVVRVNSYGRLVVTDN